MTSAQDQSVQALRSAYLFYFSHFIEWPSEISFPGKRFDLCALTSDLEDVFQLKTIDKKSLGELQLRINIFSAQMGNSSFDYALCNMLYVSEYYSDWLAVHGAQLPRSILLISEGEQKYKGPIHLFMYQNKLKFEIDIRKLQQDNFKVSSKLLRLSMIRGGHAQTDQK